MKLIKRKHDNTNDKENREMKRKTKQCNKTQINDISTTRITTIKKAEHTCEKRKKEEANKDKQNNIRDKKTKKKKSYRSKNKL
jgi:hypothetical protein